MQDGGAFRCSTLLARRSRFRPASRRPTVWLWAPPGPRPGSCSPPGRAADRAAQPGPVLPAHLRPQQGQAHQGPSPAAHGRLTPERPRRPSPRRANDLGAHPDQHNPGDLHRHRRPSTAGGALPAAWPTRQGPGLTRCYRRQLQSGSLRSWERSFSQVELGGLEPPTPCLQSDVFACCGRADLARQSSVSSHEVPLLTLLMAR
jgi:hypothetical protein